MDKLTLIEMSKRRHQKACTTFCCEEHGLVKLNRPKKISRREKALLDAVLAPGVVEADLIDKRGGRQEGSEDGGRDDGGDGTSSRESDSEISSILLSRSTSTRVTPLHADDALPNDSSVLFAASRNTHMPQQPEQKHALGGGSRVGDGESLAAVSDDDV